MKPLTTLLSKDNITKAEKKITFGIYYILPIITIITLIFAGTATSNIGFSRQESRWNIGFNLLMILLFIKPIFFLLRKYTQGESISLAHFFLTLKNIPANFKKNPTINNQRLKNNIFPFIINGVYSITSYLMRFRRQLWIATFWLLVTHGLLRMIFRSRQGLPFLFNIRQTTIFTGILGLIALTIGALTSNTYAVQKLKKNRKKVQNTVYLAFLFGAIHTGNIFWLIIYIILKYLELKDTDIINQGKVVITGILFRIQKKLIK